MSPVTVSGRIAISGLFGFKRAREFHKATKQRVVLSLGISSLRRSSIPLETISAPGSPAKLLGIDATAAGREESC